jgi:mRNA-degrading endonuclease toxin of MazEF toxin-antitoxin module
MPATAGKSDLQTNCHRIYPSQVKFKQGVGGLLIDTVIRCEQIRALTVSRLRDR